MVIFDWIGWVFGFIIYFGYDVSGVYVVGLILFTIAVKLVMFPFAIKQQKTTAKQQRLGPKLQEIKDRYGNDKQKVQQETMALYQKENANPMGGCLPLLLQFPIIIGLYSAVIKPLSCVLHFSSDKIAQAVALLTEKSAYQEIAVINHFGDLQEKLGAIFSGGQMQELSDLARGGFDLFGMNLLVTPTFTNIQIIIPILCFVSSMAMSIFMNRLSAANNTSGQPGGGCMKWGMPIFMSVFSTWIAFSVPAAVGLYWILSNLLSIFQSYMLNKFYNAGRMDAQERAARLARRRLEEKAILDTGVGVDMDIRALAEQIRLDEQESTELPARKEQRPITNKTVQNSNEKVIKTGNAARAGQAGQKKKKK